MGIFSPISLDRKKFAARFKQLREEAGLKRIQFGFPPGATDEGSEDEQKQYLGIADRKTVYKWEKGQAFPSLEVIVQLCNLFECDFEYLIGEQSTPRRATIDVQNATGLSEEAAEKLLALKKYTINGEAFLMLINAMIEDDVFTKAAANALYSLLMVPEHSRIELSSVSKNKVRTPLLFSHNDVDDIRRLYAADLQNIIFKFIEQQFLSKSQEE